MGRWGSSLLIFILVRKCWQNNYKRRYHTGQASVFHELFVKDDLSQPLLLHRLGELHKKVSCWRKTLQRLWNGRDFSDVTLVCGHWRWLAQKTTIKEGITTAKPQSFINFSWRMTSQNLLLHSLGELRMGPRWMMRRRTTPVPTLGRGGFRLVNNQVDKEVVCWVFVDDKEWEKKEESSCNM